jgi:hypothetical protein
MSWEVPEVKAPSIAIAALACGLLSSPCLGGPGTEAAGFLDIPIGGRPAALGGAYSALAYDAYAPAWNPAGLGFLPSTQFATTHLSYLDGISYEYLSLVDPVWKRHGFGASVQYYHTGVMHGMDDAGAPTIDFTSYYAAYTLAYGHAFNDKLSLGAAGKLITARISDASARSVALDLGSLYRFNERWSAAAVLAQLGGGLSFSGTGDPLPSAFRLGGAYRPRRELSLSVEGAAPFHSGPTFHAGGEWIVQDLLALRLGYGTQSGLSALGQEFDYAWVPFGELGSTHYFSLVLRFGASPRGGGDGAAAPPRPAPPGASPAREEVGMLGQPEARP